MKIKYVILTLLTIMLMQIYVLASAEEIMFRGLSWRATPFEFETLLSNDGITAKPTSQSIQIDYKFLQSELHSSYALDERWFCKDFPFYTRYIQYPKCKVAGYNLQAISADFVPAHDGIDSVDFSLPSSQLFSATYVITDFSSGTSDSIEDAYSDLKNKITSLYGDCVKLTGKNPSVVFWKGDNDTCVALRLYDTAIQIAYFSGVDMDSAQTIKTAYNNIQKESIDGL